MRLTAVFAVVCLSGLALAQQGGLQVAVKKVELGPPAAVALGVDEVFWKDDGTALAYYAKDADGTYLGVFNQETGKSKAMLRFAEGTNVHFEQWLPYRPMYVIALSQPAGQGFKRWSIVTIDARLLTSKTVWTAQYGEKDAVGIDLDVSPSRDHAIITVTDPKGQTPIVLLEGALSAVYSRDLATAREQGMRFAGWSADGTAYFAAGAQQQEAGVTFQIHDALISSVRQSVELKLSSGEGEFVFDSVPLLGKFFKFSPTAPKTGTPVYELMPNNATLRPVLSKGPYVHPEGSPHVVYPVQEETIATAQQRRDGAHALWMVGLTYEEGAPYTKDGVLIGLDVSKFWMCDDGNWVAYQTGGALFVRRITYGGQPYSPSLVRKG
jgi:hypothetical protein